MRSEILQNKTAEACVIRHRTDDFRTCNSDPFINDEDESHCIIRFCNKHAEEYKSVQKLDNLEGLDIHFKEKKRHR